MSANAGDKADGLRIVMLTTFFPPYNFGGDGIGIERLALALSQRGHDVTVVHDIDAYRTLSKSEPIATARTDGVRTVGLSSKIGSLSNLLTHQLGTPVVHRSRLQEILAPGAFDIVWFHNISLVGGPGLLAFGDGLKVYEAHEHWLVCPTHVLWRHGRELCDSRQCLRCVISYRRPPQLWRSLGSLQRQLDHVDVFLAKSEFSRRKHELFGFPKKMEVVPYFLPDKPRPRIAAEDSPHGRPFFLFVGRLEKIKGLDDVIPVFAGYPDADLLIIGTGEYEAELKRQAAQIPNVVFVGRLKPEELARYYASAIALIVPSVCFETFGIILIESFREGTPVIARKIGPFVEIVERCAGGALFSDGDELLSAMYELQGDSGQRAAMADAARSGFEQYWSEGAVLAEYLGALRRAAVEKGDEKVAAALEPQNTPR
jgi:glycosyltransferase involved in cell wall biosynthesis